jgi:hypothetical protein
MLSPYGGEIERGASAQSLDSLALTQNPHPDRVKPYERAIFRKVQEGERRRGGVLYSTSHKEP